jgi:tRNA threonylcarbamoyladenosine biosynthesis protein TsaE
LVLVLPDERATRSLAARIAARARPGDVIALSGPLGAGKTSFARAFIRARFGAAEEVPSPTFTLVETYSGEGPPIWHFDLYRLDRPEDAWELGIEDAFAGGISLIEWPERLGALLPPGRLQVALAFVHAAEIELHSSSPRKRGPRASDGVAALGPRFRGDDGGGEGRELETLSTARIATLSPSPLWANRLEP